MDDASTSQSVVAWLRGGGPWGAPPAVIETHAAIVFLSGDRAFKMKKPVSLGYLDFSTLEARRSTLARELVLNRRTASGFYLGLVPVVAQGSSFALDGVGDAVEWLLEMKRFPEGSLLSERLAAGALGPDTIEVLARRVARFHDSAAIVADVDWSAAVQRIAGENEQDLLSLQSVFEGQRLKDQLLRRNARLAALGPALRRQDGDVRQCHGDLHLGNVFLDGDVPTLFDCIEFSSFYAQIPPLYDIAFLLMDLLARGERFLANRALNAWMMARDTARWPDDMAALALLPLYVALRAEIRAKTEARRAGGAAAACHYLDLAAASALPSEPRLIVIGGLSGTGKSTLARGLASQAFAGVGAVHLRSDEIRKRLAGIELSGRLPSSSYTPEVSGWVYEMLYRLAGTCLDAGADVVVDAVFARAEERDRIEQTARVCGVPFLGFWLEAPPAVLEARVAGRKGDVSDADSAVLKAQLAYDTGAIGWTRVDVSGQPEQVERTALDVIGRVDG
jgi:aminoglycoside phosphotransferase family enzyme/predicted kinase